MIERRNRRWNVGLLVATVTAVVGTVAGNTTLVLAATVGLTFTAYGYLTSPPSVAVAVTREVAETADPGDRLAVTLDVENEGDETVPELRVLDDPPGDLRVVEGTPSAATSLEPGETERFEYTLRASRGTHEFEGPVLEARSVDGRVERRWSAERSATVSVTSGLESFPPAGQTVGYTGRVPTDEGGPGLEFHSVREYHPEDPMKRVDWNRYARTGELRTIDFREHRAASVVVLVDLREDVTRYRHLGESDSAELATEAATEIVEALLDWNNLVGVATVANDLVYLEPDVGPNQRHRADLVLDDRVRTVETARRLAVVSDSPWAYIERLNDRLPDDTQVVFVSPFLDDAAATITRQLRAHGHATTVVSPDVTTDATPGGTVARIERERRVEETREQGTRVVEWSVDEPLYAAVERATGRWST